MGKMTVQQMLIQLAGGMGTSIQIFLVTLIFSLPLGLLVAFGRMSKNRLLQAIVKVYISIMRGTPLMLQLMVVYFGPYYLFRIKVGSGYRLWAAFIGFVINYAAYFAEIYRSGIQSMPVGQYEAAQILGYSRFQTFSNHTAPGHQTDSSVCNQRGHHPCQGHLPGLYPQRGGDVLHSQGSGSVPDQHDSLCGRRSVLLYFQPGSGSWNGVG